MIWHKGLPFFIYLNKNAFLNIRLSKIEYRGMFFITPKRRNIDLNT